MCSLYHSRMKYCCPDHIHRLCCLLLSIHLWLHSVRHLESLFLQRLFLFVFSLCLNDETKHSALCCSGFLKPAGRGNAVAVMQNRNGSDVCLNLTLRNMFHPLTMSTHITHARRHPYPHSYFCFHARCTRRIYKPVHFDNCIRHAFNETLCVVLWRGQMFEMKPGTFHQEGLPRAKMSTSTRAVKWTYSTGLIPSLIWTLGSVTNFPSLPLNLTRNDGFNTSYLTKRPEHRGGMTTKEKYKTCPLEYDFTAEATSPVPRTRAQKGLSAAPAPDDASPRESGLSVLGNIRATHDTWLPHLCYVPSVQAPSFWTTRKFKYVWAGDCRA